MEPQMKVDRCTTRLLRMYPFWGSLILGFEIQQTSSYPRMATNGTVLWYNPEYVQDQSEEILTTDLAHEAGHKMFLDHFRRGTRDPKLWNVACDYRINLYLQDSGLKLGDEYLVDERFRGMDVEKIYDILAKDPEDPANQQAQEKGGCGCDGLQDHPSHERGEDQGDEEGEGENGGQDNGEGDQGATQPEETLGPMPGVDFGESEVMTQVAQARDFAKSQGNFPANLDQLVEEFLNPRVRWEQVLQRFMECCCQDDFTWQTPDRRFLYLDMYLPALESEGVDAFAICVDTSASTDPFIPQFLSEISKIAAVLKFRTLYVIYSDLAVQHVDEYDQGSLPIRPTRSYGGGGTDFRPVFNWLDQRGIAPKGMVYLTDTYGSFPKVPPSFPVLWTVPSQCKRSSVPFGEIVRVD